MTTVLEDGSSSDSLLSLPPDLAAFIPFKINPCINPIPQTVMYDTTHAMNTADDAAPPNRNMTLDRAVTVNIPGMIATGVAANPDAKDMITGIPGKMI